jgi:hypothetical protein
MFNTFLFSLLLACRDGVDNFSRCGISNGVKQAGDGKSGDAA